MSYSRINFQDEVTKLNAANLNTIDVALYNHSLATVLTVDDETPDFPNSVQGIAKSLFDAYSILYADVDNTPAALSVAASRIVGRKATGGIAALTAAEAKTLLAIAIADISDIPGTIASILTDHNKATHDALGIAPATHTIDKHTNVTRRLFVPATGGYTNGEVAAMGNWAIVMLDDIADEQVNISFRVPNDYASGGVIKFVYISGTLSSNDVIWDMKLYHATDGELWSSNSSTDLGNVLTEPVDDEIHEVSTTLTFTSLSKSDYVGLEFLRDADNANDTYGYDFLLLGFIFEYTAEQ